MSRVLRFNDFEWALRRNKWNWEKLLVISYKWWSHRNYVIFPCRHYSTFIIKWTERYYYIDIFTAHQIRLYQHGIPCIASCGPNDGQHFGKWQTFFLQPLLIRIFHSNRKHYPIVLFLCHQYWSVRDNLLYSEAKLFISSRTTINP